MSVISKIIACLLSVLCLIGLFPLSAFGEESNLSAPQLSAGSAILMCAENGEVIFEKNANARLPMASTTKLMTALVAMQIADPSCSITVDWKAVGVEGSSIYLTAGETLTLEQLLYALLLESANDAATAIAIGLSGSVEAFADEMNRMADALGLSDTHFTNPHGLDDKAHYTTAQNLAIIGRAVLQNELLRTITATRKTTIPHDGTDGVRLLVNHNKLLRLYEGCIGLKTGFTKKSGRCLVSAAERDGVTLIAVTLNAPDDWDDHKQLFDYGFSKYEAKTLAKKGDILHPLPIVGGNDAYVMLGNAEEITVTLPKSAKEVKTVLHARRFEYAAVKEGDICGEAVFLCDTDGDGKESVIARAPLYALYSVERPVQKFSLWAWIKSLFT